MIHKSGRRLALLAVAGIVLAQGVAVAAQPLRLTKPVNATKADLNPNRTYSAPFLAVDPTNSLNVVGSYVDLRTRRCGLIRSVDGGQTWKQLDASPTPAAYPSCLSTSRWVFMSPAAFGRNGTLYVATPAWDIQDKALNNYSIQVSRSTDLGDTWQSVLVRDNRAKQGNDVESARPVGGVVVDTKTGSDDVVYVGYTFTTPNITAPNANPGRVVVATSTNGGRSFGAPVDITASAWASDALRTQAIQSPQSTTTTINPTATTTTTTTPAAGSRVAQPNQAANFGGGAPTMTTDAKGNIYVYWQSSSANITPSPLNAIFVAKSTDHGKTWTSTKMAGFDVSAKVGSLGRLAWSPKGGPDGTLHLVYQATDTPEVNSAGTIYYQQSTDGGKSFSPRRVVADAPPALLTSQVGPNMSVAPDGRVDVAWWDTRDDPGIRGNDVYYTYSTDNGKTWSANTRITDQSDNRNYGVWSSNFDMETPPGIVSTNNYALFSWDDTRNTDTSFKDNLTTGGGVSDIFTANVQFKAVGGGTSKVAKAVFAGVIGLVAVGLILLVAALATRRRSDGQPRPPRKVDTKARAGVG